VPTGDASEPMTMMRHLIVEMVTELLQIAIESDGEAVASDGESILTLYENNQTPGSKLMALP
jgi:hypothetical protein